jgi:hypothetical protein
VGPIINLPLPPSSIMSLLPTPLTTDEKGPVKEERERVYTREVDTAAELAAGSDEPLNPAEALRLRSNILSHKFVDPLLGLIIVHL